MHCKLTTHFMFWAFIQDLCYSFLSTYLSLSLSIYIYIFCEALRYCVRRRLLFGRCSTWYSSQCLWWRQWGRHNAQEEWKEARFTEEGHAAINNVSTWWMCIGGRLVASADISARLEFSPNSRHREYWLVVLPNSNVLHVCIDARVEIRIVVFPYLI